MAVSDKIKEMAHKEAFKHYFCNVDTFDWPDDPDAFIEKVVWRSEEEECEAAELSYDDENGKCMNIWAPFEHHTISDIQGLMMDFETALINFYEEARKLDKENQRMVRDKPFVESAIRWKPAAEALPMISDRILFSVKNDESVKVGQYDGKHFVEGRIIQYFYDPKCVLWWAYVPKPPKEE